MLTLGPSDLVTWAGVTSLEPEQTWVPRLECLGFEGASKICLAMSPLPKDLENLQLWEGKEEVSSCSHAKPNAPKGCWNFWDGRALKSPLGSKTPGGGDPHTSLLPWGHPHLRMTSPSIEWSCRN